MTSANYRPDLSEFGVVIPKPPEPEALDAAIANASKPLPGSTALRLYLEEQTREAAQAIPEPLDVPVGIWNTGEWDPA